MDFVHLIGDDQQSTFPPLPLRIGGFNIFKNKLALALPDSYLYGVLFGMTKTKKLHSDSVKRYLAPDRLIQLTKHLCDTYQPVAVIAEYVFAAPCLDVVPEGILKIIDTIDVFSRKKAEVLSFGIDDPLPCSFREERNYLLKSDLVIASPAERGQYVPPSRPPA